MIWMIRLVLMFSVLGLCAQQAGGKWSYMGPKENAYQFKGIITSVWADETNMDHILAGSYCGGLFETYNGLSENPDWANISDNLPYMNFGVSGIVVQKNRGKETIYITTNTGGGLLTQGFGNGILYTEDGGKNWRQIGPSGKEAYDFPLMGLVANKEDQNEMMAFNQKELFITQDSWRTYRTLNLPFHKDVDKLEIAEAEFAPYERGKVYVTTRTYIKNKAQLLVSVDYGTNWQDITPPDVACERIALATIGNPKYKGKFYITSGNSDIYLKYFNGLSFSGNLNSVPVNNFGASSFWCLELKVNSVDTSVVYLSLTETSVSRDGGKSFLKIGYYNGANTHADVREMILPVSTKSGKYDRLLLANDGGLSMSKDFNALNNVAFRSLNGNGLNANQFWGIDVLQSDSLFIAGGAQDNGGFFIKDKKERNNLMYTGDAYYGLVLNDSIALMLGNPPNFMTYNVNSGYNVYISIPDPNCEARRPLMMKDSFVYVAYHDLWRARVKDVVALNGGFKNISNIPRLIDPKKGAQNREIKALAISPANKALIGYSNPNWDAEKNEGKLYYCPDLLAKNREYTDVSELASNAQISLCRWYQVESLVADGRVENEFYMIYKDVFSAVNSDVYRFIYYPDSNKSELKKINYNLRRIGFNKLKVHAPSNTLYLAANDGVYYLKLNSEDTVWKNLGFFPKVLTSDLVFNYFTNSIYVATFARGIWGSQVPSFHDQAITIRKNKTESDPVRVDGVLTVGPRKTYQINTKLIITSQSKIQLKNKSRLVIGAKAKVVDENNKPVDLLKFVVKHKTALVQFLK